MDWDQLLSQTPQDHGAQHAPRSYSPGMPSPVGSSHTVGRVCSQAAQFTSSTLLTENQLSRPRKPAAQPSLPQRVWPLPTSVSCAKALVDVGTGRGRDFSALLCRHWAEQKSVPSGLFTASWVAQSNQRRTEIRPSWCSGWEGPFVAVSYAESPHSPCSAAFP